MLAVVGKPFVAELAAAASPALAAGIETADGTVLEESVPAVRGVDGVWRSRQRVDFPGELFVSWRAAGVQVARETVVVSDTVGGRSGLDVLRSAKRYVALALPDYEVRLVSEEGAWARPFARVGWSTPESVRQQGRDQQEVRRTLSVVAWTRNAAHPNDLDQRWSPDRARSAAGNLVDRLSDAFTRGIDVETFVRGRRHPMRFPIFNYTGISMEEPATAADRAARDFARIEGEPSIGDIEDPQDELSRIVTTELRVAWSRWVGYLERDPLVTEVRSRPKR